MTPWDTLKRVRTEGATGTRHSPRPLLGERFINASGATRREIADSYVKLFWLFENRIGNLEAAVGWAKRKRAHHPCNSDRSIWNGGHGAGAPLPTLRLRLMNTSAPRPQLSSPAKAGDPVLRDVSDEIEKA